MTDWIISHIIIHTISASGEMKNTECAFTLKELILTIDAELHFYYNISNNYRLGPVKTQVT